MKTSVLIGPALEWAVEAAKEAQFGEGRVVKICRRDPATPAWIEVENSPGSAPYFHRSSHSTDWAQGGPIIEREALTICTQMTRFDWQAINFHGDITQFGPTPLIAAMRCYVALKIGNEINIPEELT